jgi:hypothetical protein
LTIHHLIITGKDGILFHDYTKDQMHAVADDPNAYTWVVKLLLRHVGLSTRGTRPKVQANLLTSALHFSVRTGFQIVGNPDANSRSTFNSERMASGEYNLAQYQADRYEYEAFGGSQLHPLMNLSTDQVCTYQAQPGDPRPILFISSLQDVAASMSISKIGNICAASVLKQRLVCVHDFKLSKNSTISPFCADPKYKDNKNRQYD